MVAATAREKRQTSGQPSPKAAPPTLESPWWNEVTPPARMQMIEREMAKFEKAPIPRGSSGSYPRVRSVRSSSAMTSFSPASCIAP
jgi:hypothetical protein